MIFREPIPFDEAIASRAARALMPTTLTSDELKKVRPGIREQSTFSAQTDSARHVQKIADLSRDVLKPEGGIGMAEFMQELRDSAKSLGFDPETGGKSITNLASDARVRLIADFNTRRALAAGQYSQRQDSTSLDLWPAQEFYRAEDREEVRDWPAKWEANGGEFFPGKADYSQGRMIALVNDPIWEAISAFGSPFAPFDFNSGMDVRPIDRQEAEELGLIEPGEQVVPEEVDLSEPETTLRLDSDLEEQILEDLGAGYRFEDGPDGERILTKDSISARNSYFQSSELFAHNAFDANEARDKDGKWTSGSIPTAERDENSQQNLKPKILSGEHPISHLPIELQSEMKGWQVVSKSPYSQSYYDITNKSWGPDPHGFQRIADHWNWSGEGKLHAQTDVPVKNGYWTQAKYNAESGKYEVIKSVPRPSQTKIESEVGPLKPAADLAAEKVLSHVERIKSDWQSAKGAQKRAYSSFFEKYNSDRDKFLEKNYPDIPKEHRDAIAFHSWGGIIKNTGQKGNPALATKQELSDNFVSKVETGLKQKWTSILKKGEA